MISVIGISASGQEQLLRQLDQLGTNLLRVEPGKALMGDPVKLHPDAALMVRRISGVTDASVTGTVDASVRRTDRIPKSVAAQRLGVGRTGVQVWVGDRWFAVTGILASMPLAPEIDRAALIGFPVAQERLGFDGHPTTVYERSSEESVEQVAGMLARTVSPERPYEIAVSRPSDALVARAAAAGTFTSLLLGLGAVALLVGGVGVANTMVISVLERRKEIGLRRALGATRGQIRIQFLTESLLLSALGGVAGLALGGLVTTGYALWQGWPPTVPAWVLAGAFAATLAVGAIAGIYPAIRASHLPTTVALASS
ncbi:ABC transporter permease [Nonomuraea spiralis]|uniref:ABC transporter permease n=1 Tax=Nonomuraea spiralis TaxID=46182 RepID=UPI00378CD494